MNLAVNKMKRNQKFTPDAHTTLMHQVKEVLRYHHHACRTEKTYFDWIVRYSESSTTTRGGFSAPCTAHQGVPCALMKKGIVFPKTVKSFAIAQR